jgi:hypothetical protein
MSRLNRRLKQLEKQVNEADDDPMCAYRRLTPHETVEKAIAEINRINAEIERRRARGIEPPGRRAPETQIAEVRSLIDGLIKRLDNDVEAR